MNLVYININTLAEKVYLQFKFGADGVESRGWSIKITILPCSSVTLGIQISYYHS